MSTYFEKRAWVCVSDVFDVLNITKTILQSITELPCEGKDLNWLQVKLKDDLSEKKFLVVLDDVWNVKYEEWTSLLKPFEAGARESKIIITTRNHPIYFMTGAMPYFLNELSIDNCTRLLAYHALGVKNFEGHPNLEIIGKKIAKKCKGLPLVAKILGSLLRNKENADEWEAILNDRIWDVATGENGEVLPILKLSYVYLPSNLKRCFAYCAIFPKDYEFERDELVVLWIAEGFLNGQEAIDNLTSGRNCFNELVSRSFFQQSSVDTSKFSMHDLLNDLAKSIANATYFTSGESQSVGDKDGASFKEKARYASFVSGWYVTSNNLRPYARMKVLRSLIMLPESVGALCKLQALILRGCRNLSMLPSNITNLVSLQFLDIRDTSSLKEMPSRINNLKNLIVLSKFVVGPKKGSHVKELNNLPHLQGELLISKLEKLKEDRDATYANLFGKEGLSNLILLWDKDFRNPRNNEREIVSLCLSGCANVKLLPSLGQLPSLRELFVEGLNAVSKIGAEFCGTKRPFPSLTTLKFENMPAWKEWSLYIGGREGVPFSCLQHLIVQECPVLTGTLPCQLDRLVKLEIHSCLHLNNSTSVICLPSLCELHIANCNKEILKSLINLTSLTILEIEDLVELVCFDNEFMSYLVKLKELHLRRCAKLTYLLQDGDGMRNLTCLKELAIRSCPQFTSFVAGEGEIELLCNPERMKLWNCMNLERLPSKMHALRHLSIRNCPKIMGLTIPSNNPNSKTLIVEDCKGVELLEEITIVESLKSLDIHKCVNLGSLPHCLHMLAHLTRLEISGCPALEIEDFPPLPLTLSSLSLKGCLKIKSIANCNIANCNNLTYLEINDCLALEMEDFPLLPITLSELRLGECPKMKSLPKEWHHLTCLQRLEISTCENIECFPEGGLPPNLLTFIIRECKNMKQPVREWGLPLLTSLESLEIDGISMGGEGDKVGFPLRDEDEEENAWSLLFPSSLTNLRLQNMRNVERLSSGLRRHLSSLLQLWIVNCPKLRDLPEYGLPPSLLRLWIRGCKNLEDRCSKHSSDYWPLIQEIPLILVKG
ncbi:hypothetical protein BT93_L0206 [Corymbia citriodora subsp. variegata]|uniref:NB-ARC domain-containing protein n=1 Tax=Corymbia citriodora subsp. variegata TaxID=360336 RepID=A0A8T0CSV7_CORYI|nr:hypothetical protein BT93_L0206 [Corymbia citriodora subsp. variegata]